MSRWGYFIGHQIHWLGYSHLKCSDCHCLTVCHQISYPFYVPLQFLLLITQSTVLMLQCLHLPQSLYLYHLYIQIKKDKQNIPHLMHLTVCLCLMLAHVLCLALALAPCPLSGCIQLDSALFHSFSPIITNTPIHLLSHYALLHTCSRLCSHYASTLSSLCTCIETVPYPLITPLKPHRAFIVIKPHSSYFTIAAAGTSLCYWFGVAKEQ